MIQTKVTFIFIFICSDKQMLYTTRPSKLREFGRGYF